MSEKTKVAIIGSGNWGSAIAKIIGSNVQEIDYFDKEVKMHVFEEIVNGMKLTEIINTTHENVKYLPGHKLPPTIVAIPDVVEATKDADILVFVLPHQFVLSTCEPLIGKIKPNAVGLSLIKGFGEENGHIQLISNQISSILNIECAVLMGANLANEVAEEQFCETTIGCADPKAGKVLKDLVDTPNFRVTVVPDRQTVEVCGALKNVVACAAGFCDGLDYGDNTKAAVIRIGLKEIIRFCKTFYPEPRISTFFESCGVADLVTTCYGGRNRRLSEMFVKESTKSFTDLEKEHLKGQKLQGPQTAQEVLVLLKATGNETKFPLFYAVSQITKRELEPHKLIDYLRNEPED
ncbi:glycerol-3-phosphate dehydrogenase [NAD(+)]: cytoplasmic-like isoform X1 [Dinothrombium tinctorium]|uniref:Glycerol-3-phosphate dehydrogenase [NAD(+)] n=1 Tax=Dinothrombium tinctorium TaxID=1965070 RepID=A0A443QAL2_9ACAR|nr:glycerol-3-phosphate dehydrogenase [NAD(+)]: cytoplasmic-like isoform X1 [Dinothrombium tinctorium]